MKNNQKGITLIALVVTIIVLLILAGVSIAMLTGQTGILGNAQAAAWKTKIGEAKDQLGLTVANYYSDYVGWYYANIEPSISAVKGYNSENQAMLEGAKAAAAELAEDSKFDIKVTGTDKIDSVTIQYNGNPSSPVTGTPSGTSGRINWSDEASSAT